MMMTTRTASRVARLPNTVWKFMNTPKPKLMTTFRKIHTS